MNKYSEINAFAEYKLKAIKVVYNKYYKLK